MIQSKNVNGVTVLIPVGNLTLIDGERRFKRKIESLLENGDTKVLIDFSKIELMDSSGLGELLYSKSSLEKAGGKLKLLNVRGNIKKILEITRVNSVFEIFDDEDKALDSF